MIHMAYVTAADEDSAPTVLIVDNNPMSTRRLTEVFRVKEFHVVVCEDGDQAVDEYIRLDPELVVIEELGIDVVVVTDGVARSSMDKSVSGDNV